MSKNFLNLVILRLLSPNSPYINPVCYYVWSVVERDSICHSQYIVTFHYAAFVYVIANVPNTDLIIACSQFWQVIEAVIAAGGSSNEWCHPLCIYSPDRTLKCKICSISSTCSCLKMALFCSQKPACLFPSYLRFFRYMNWQYPGTQQSNEIKNPDNIHFCTTKYVLISDLNFMSFNPFWTKNEFFSF